MPHNVINGTDLDNILTGSATHDTINGLDGNDTLFGLGDNDVLNGGFGNDVLDGGAGADTMDGGYGDDTYVVNHSGDIIFDTLFRTPDVPDTGNDTVRSHISYTLSNTPNATLENLTLVGTTGISGTGNALNNVLTGNSSNNVLSGLGGNDTLNGGLGNDHLVGGTGADIMNGGRGNDRYEVDNAQDVVNDPANIVVKGDLITGGIDMVWSSLPTYTLGTTIENLTLGGIAAVTGTGNASNNTIIGSSANNVLSGLAGNDTLSSGLGNDTLLGGNGDDALDGGTGLDTMNGGLGNDVYIVDNPLDTVTDPDAVIGGIPLSGGIDRVTSLITYTLGATIENLTLGGTAAINGTGNAKNNVIRGNSGNNVLSGLDGNDQISGDNGNDTLRGGFGADSLTGGFGRDLFDYNAVGESPAGAGKDRIVDFTGNGALAGDQIDLLDIDANARIAGNQAFTYLGGAAFTAAGQLRYAGGVVQGNNDADLATVEIEIQVSGSPVLSVGGIGTDILL